MRLFKLLMYCTMLSSILLVGCNKDKNEVEPEVVVIEEEEVVPAFIVLEAGTFTAIQEVTSGCNDKSENEIVPADCVDEGCFQYQLNADGTAQLLGFNVDEGSEVWFEGAFTIVEEAITITFLAGGVNDWLDEDISWTGIITATDKFSLIQSDEEESGCIWTADFAK